MVSIIACVGMRTISMATMELHEMAAMLQLIKGWRDMQPRNTTYIFDTGHPCYDQLTPVKARYMLTSIMSPCCRLKLRACWDRVFFDHWPSTGFSLDHRLMSGYNLLCNQNRVVQKLFNAFSGLKSNLSKIFLVNVFFTAFFCAVWDYSKQKAKQYYKQKKPHCKLKSISQS